MAPKRTTRSTRVPPVTPAPTTTTVTESQLQALIDQGVAAAMAEAEASRVRNGYNSNGSHVFLAHVTTKEIEDKSEKKRLEDVPIVKDFPNVFPEDLPGLPQTRQVEFQIDTTP
ncbi:hypothetical protein Tco_0074550 [Tanacetum coccineum]